MLIFLTIVAVSTLLPGLEMVALRSSNELWEACRDASDENVQTFWSDFVFIRGITSMTTYIINGASYSRWQRYHTSPRSLELQNFAIFGRPDPPVLAVFFLSIRNFVWNLVFFCVGYMFATRCILYPICDVETIMNLCYFRSMTPDVSRPSFIALSWCVRTV